MNTMHTNDRGVRRVLAIALSVLGAVMVLTGLDMGWRGVLVMLGIAVYVGGTLAWVELRR